jgi:patatin-like phospholipase/acyl hydrolase
MTLQEKLTKKGPRKLLALDGGGIRGLITIEILARVEEILRQKTNGGPSFVLADYFDYVAGTSTGAIIATCISLGWPVAKIREFYLESGPHMFHPARLLERIKSKYNEDKLSQMLKDKIGENEGLGSSKLRTLLMMVLRNATTDSPWPLSNNPRAKYNDRKPSNLDLPLWQLVRASTAAPTYFPPEVMKVDSQTFIFVDGGVTTYNNPAFHLFLMATIEPYNLRWPVGEQQMLLISIGTGTAADENASLRPDQMNLLYNASSVPSALMAAALHEQDLLCRSFGKCLAGSLIDREVGDMIGKAGPVSPKLFTYARYNCELTRQSLDRLGLPKSLNPKDVQKLDATDHMDSLQQIGGAVAKAEVQASHFAGFEI